MKNKKSVLIITDGIGYNKSCEFNAFCNAKTPTYDYLFAHTPNSLIKTSGASVGLPDGQMGNSEVGHMSIGSGRVLYQDLVKINMAIRENTLKDNKTLQKVFKNSNTIHLIGLLSDGGVHSHISHIVALTLLAKQNKKSVKLHLISDGRDVSPKSVLKYIATIKELLDESVSIATIGGRFYTMDRDSRWDRVQKGYDAIIKAEPCSDMSVEEYIQHSYKSEIFDEFINPTAFSGYDGVKESDEIIFCNFRSDRMREIVEAIGSVDFNNFKKEHIRVGINTMSEYDKSFEYPILYKRDTPKNTLSEIISKNGLSQLHTAETEKYAHVTFFFNGGIDEAYKNEKRVLIPSPDVKTYDMQPQMSAESVCDAVIKGMEDNTDFIVVNFANGDMVGHTGVYEAGIKAVEAVDKELGRILDVAKELDYNLLITSDHGNCEMMRDRWGNTLTNHTIGEVFCFVVADGVESVKDGALDNIAPTILKIMGLEIPSNMSKPLF